MSVVVVLEVNVKPESANDMNKAMKENFPDTRAFDGCEGIRVHSGQDDPNNVVLVEHWASKEHHQKYLAWRTETGFMDQLMTMLDGPPSIRYYDEVDV